MPAHRKNFGPCSVDSCDSDAKIKGMCSKHYLAQRDVGPCSMEGCKYRANSRGLCRTHYARLSKYGAPDILVKHPSSPVNWKIRPNGYVEARWKRDGKHYTLSQHRAVMEETLGRSLLPGENVHHKNGVRHDNRPENLELWIVPQPYGQRVEDMVVWAKEILARYDTPETGDPPMS